MKIQILLIIVALVGISYSLNKEYIDGHNKTGCIPDNVPETLISKFKLETEFMLNPAAVISQERLAIRNNNLWNTNGDVHMQFWIQGGIIRLSLAIANSVAADGSQLFGPDFVFLHNIWYKMRIEFDHSIKTVKLFVNDQFQEEMVYTTSHPYKIRDGCYMSWTSNRSFQGKVKYVKITDMSTNTIVTELFPGCKSYDQFYFDNEDYWNAPAVCQPCDSDCDQCTSATDCVACQDPLKALPTCKTCKNSLHDLPNCDVCTNPLLEYPGCYACIDDTKQAPACTAVKCMTQCDTCDAVDSCLTCRDPSMMLPDCLYKENGNFMTVDEFGVVQIKPCGKRCQTCTIEAENCLTCRGQNRDQNCNCLPGYADNRNIDKVAYLQDCEACSTLCESCEDTFTCSTCKSEYKRVLDPFTNQCVCARGYKANPMTQICEKCYQLSDGCVTDCPENTIQNEILQMCEHIDYGLSSNINVIIFYGVLIALIQIGLCLIINMKLNKYSDEQHRIMQDKQAEIKQQRQYIYAGLSEYGSDDLKPQAKTNSIISSDKLQKQIQDNSSSQQQGGKQQRRKRRQVDVDHSQSNLINNSSMNDFS